MNIAWTSGLIIGLLAMALIFIIVRRATSRLNEPQREYDERQQLLRGKAFTAAFFTLLGYLAIWMMLNALEVGFFATRLSILVGIMLSIVVFVAYCVFHDAYFRVSERPLPWLFMTAGIAVLNLVIGVARLLRGATLQERLYENANLLMGAAFAVILVCIAIKRGMDRRSEAE